MCISDNAQGWCIILMHLSRPNDVDFAPTPCLFSQNKKNNLMHILDSTNLVPTLFKMVANG